MSLPTITTEKNFTIVELDSVRLWFSYSTLIGFVKRNGSGAGKRFVSENCWSTTTGKHLNAIDGGDKKSRLPREEFEDTYNKLVGAI